VDHCLPSPTGYLLAVKRHETWAGRGGELASAGCLCGLSFGLLLSALSLLRVRVLHRCDGGTELDGRGIDSPERDLLEHVEHVLRFVDLRRILRNLWRLGFRLPAGSLARAAAASFHSGHLILNLKVRGKSANE